MTAPALMTGKNYKPKYGTGGLDWFNSTGGWLGGFPHRGEVIDRLLQSANEYLMWRDRWVEACRRRCGDGTGDVHYAIFYRNGRLVGGGRFCGTIEEVTAAVAEIHTEHAFAPYDFRFALSDALIDGQPLHRPTIEALHTESHQ